MTLDTWILIACCISHALAGDPYLSRFGGAGDLAFSGINTFAHLEHNPCLTNLSAEFDFAILGAPFDTSTTFRPGARFGPHGIRSGSRRQRPERAYSARLALNPYASGYRVVDCGDVPMSPFSNRLAIDQLEYAYRSLLQRQPVKLQSTPPTHPKIVTLGGDHTIVLPILRALSFTYQRPISVIHFDAHLDTWTPDELFLGNEEAIKNGTYDDGRTAHGTFFHIAAEEGLLDRSIHLGIRTRLSSIEDYKHDAQVGFELVEAEEIDEIGVDGILEKVKKRIGDNLVYISLDIDVLDPAFAPATGTPESGGWSSREVKRIISGLFDLNLNIVGFDVVEVAPDYDHAGVTSFAAADIIFQLLSVVVKTDLKRAKIAFPNKDRNEL